MPRAKTWKCQRQSAGVKCGQRNPSRKQKCERCGKRKPRRTRPAHMAALSIPYERYVEINGGERCGICGVGPTPGRRLDRDHEHSGAGRPRGLLCHLCNRSLRHGVTVAWLRLAADYLERTAS